MKRDADRLFFHLQARYHRREILDAGPYVIQPDRNAKDWDTPAGVEQIRQPLQMSKLSVVIMVSGRGHGAYLYLMMM